MEKFNIRSVYAKAHKETLGNEVANQLAKEAIKEEIAYEIPMSKSFIKKELHKECNEYWNEWNEYWNMKGKNSYTYDWVKNVKRIPKTFPLDYWTVQAITGHDRFPHYFKRFAITEEEKCICGEEARSFDHYLDNCKIVANERTHLTKKYKQPSKSKTEIAGDAEGIETLRKIVQIINEEILQV